MNTTEDWLEVDFKDFKAVVRGSATLAETLAEFEKRFILLARVRTRGNLPGVAQLLNILRSTLAKDLKQHTRMRHDRTHTKE